ncbi:MAG: cytochrome c oxidase assembly protein [Sphingomonadales bacterium]|nr:cytochrome c oxidase assembly protein [Sphingomonadales bacterium]PIX67128.1 MAG: cytochrome c oxidase assembly protein [Sphingomonadales bacterium CG_4_10_14_3_um_filter_58_15]NCO49918.1 cytochrome c oxidase assembly protein [Sphingomonadales bacterium]NCP00929.1 cytochrome c oxidase assembly protein [Sphingomonadales bacterium]NCP28013.1 cytochrome c oxidase assembly protein [Sphingomonadales bacterium]
MAVATALSGKNRRSAMMAGAMGLGMLGLGFAAVPLYEVFCRVTGYGGTTQRVGEAQAATVQATTRVMAIRFDSNVNSALPWSFKPEQAVDHVTVGARDMAVYLATNNSDQPVVGTATFNVTPLLAGQYFNKIQCFCFSEQLLKPGETMRMPVLYYVDPAILDDPETKDIKEITLSYTFYRSTDEQAVDAGKGDS